MEDISLRDYFLILKKRKFIIIIATILSILAVSLGTKIIIKPEYKSFTTLIIKGYQKQENSENDQRYLNKKLMNTYSEIIKSRSVMTEVSKNLNLDLSFREMIKKVNVEIISDTDILKIEVTGSEAESVAMIANEIANVSMKQAKNMINIENIEIVDKAQTPNTPSNLSTKPNIIVGGVLGLVIGIFLVFLLEYFDTTIKTPKSIERYLGLISIGILPKTEENFLISKKPNSFEAESYRILNTNIQSIEGNRGIKTILITSPNSDEERDIVSVNMGLAMARIEKRVLLIDANIRKPNIHDILNISNKKGLSNILSGDIKYEETINTLELEKNLHVITSGSTALNPSELLSTSKMKNLIQELSSKYDSIILNAPSLGVISDSVILSTIVDGTILVCEAEKSEVEDMRIGKELLEKADANILGVILNKVNIEKNSYYQYYYKNYFLS